MNFINALISINSSSLPIADRIAGKKYFFRIDDQVEINKLVYGYFIDAYIPQDPEDPKNLQKLRCYEYFAGSLTGRRLCHELQGFLKTPEADSLHASTREIIAEYIQLLKESQEFNHHVDFFRSSELLLVFFAVTGVNIGATNKQKTLDAKDLQQLTDLALQRIQSLQVGQKAIFLTGSILHETLLFVQRTDQDCYKLHYIDSDDAELEWYIDNGSTLLQESFWKQLYTLKFSSSSFEARNKIKGPFQLRSATFDSKKFYHPMR